MKIINREIKVGTFEEWKEEDPSVYEKIFISESDANTEGEWYEETIEDFKDSKKEEGLEVDTVNFTGFLRQGDGASFTGEIDILKWLKFHKKTYLYPRVVYRIKKEEMSYKVGISRITSFYYHENTCRLDDAPWEDHFDWEKKITKDLNDQCNQLMQELEDYRKYQCQVLYTALDGEYEYLSSEEAVAEVLGKDVFDQYGKFFQSEACKC